MKKRRFYKTIEDQKTIKEFLRVEVESSSSYISFNNTKASLFIVMFIFVFSKIVGWFSENLSIQIITDFGSLIVLIVVVLLLTYDMLESTENKNKIIDDYDRILFDPKKYNLNIYKEKPNWISRKFKREHLFDYKLVDKDENEKATHKT